MCHGISITRCEIPEPLIERYRLADRVMRRNENADQELRFLLAERSPVLPVWHDRQLQIVHWGHQGGDARLPVSGWCPFESLEAGRWSHLKPQEVFIPASFGWDRGIWYQIKEGLKGVLVLDMHGVPRVFVQTQRATHYYQIMTRSEREPVFVGEQI